MTTKMFYNVGHRSVSTETVLSAAAERRFRRRRRRRHGGADLRRHRPDVQLSRAAATSDVIG